VRGPDELADGAKRGHGKKEALADQRVALHVDPLVVAEGAGLVEDRLGDGDLADVV
jgi:hypothetical protein